MAILNLLSLFTLGSVFQHLSWREEDHPQTSKAGFPRGALHTRTPSSPCATN